MPSATSTRLPSAFSRLAWSNLAAQTAEQVRLAATPLVAVLALGAGAGETGLLQTAQTLPFLLLAVPAGVLADRASRRQLMVWAEGLRVVSLLGVLGPLAGLAAAVVMLLTIWIPSAWLAALSFFLIGAGPLLWTISTTTLRQSVTPGEMLGRVSAVIVTATYGARPVGASIGAFMGGAYGPELCIVVAALGFLVQALVILTSPVTRLVRQPGLAA